MKGFDSLSRSRLWAGFRNEVQAIPFWNLCVQLFVERDDEVQIDYRINVRLVAPIHVRLESCEVGFPASSFHHSTHHQKLLSVRLIFCRATGVSVYRARLKATSLGSPVNDTPLRFGTYP